jgi:HAD superfamily hydrolase (TIGR01549 family)
MDIVLFDIDGTLVDSNYLHTIAWSRAFRQHDIDVPAWDIHRHIGMGGDRLVAAVAGDEVEERLGDDVRDRWEQEYDRIIDECRPFERAQELLATVGERGLEVVIASSSIPRHAERAMELLRAGEHADAATTSEDAEESKPDPELIDKALEKVEGSKAFMVGDAVWDVLAANEREIPTIGLLTGGYGRAELIDAGAVAVYRDPGDLLDHLDEALAAVESARQGTTPKAH